MQPLQLEQALYSGRVNRVEIEVLQQGTCRWSLCDNDQPLFTTEADPASRDVMIELTGVIVNTLAKQSAAAAAEQN